MRVFLCGKGLESNVPESVPSGWKNGNGHAERSLLSGAEYDAWSQTYEELAESAQ